ncbi:MAG: carbohydrate kinase family protein [Verrucomicrobiales bacterium]|nr:carbohydrate kinase family protein [Verrucomicrobiales bacterium]
MAVIISKPNKGPSRAGVLAAGNWIVDEVKLIDTYPTVEKLANIQSQTLGTGGAPYNVLVDLSRLGATFPLLAAGLVGNDAFGERIQADCQAHKIDTRLLKSTNKAPTSYTDVMTESGNGRRTFFHFRGANALWDGSDLDFSRSKAKLLHLGYLLLLDALDQPDKKYGTRGAALLAKAQDAGLRTSVDVITEDSDRYAKFVVPALKYTDYLIVNELEAGKISGFKIRQTDGTLDTVSLRHAAGALLQMGIRELVVIHFPEGAFARTRKGEDVWQSSLRVPQKQIAGTAGAGDAFAAGVLFGLHEGWELAKCLQTAVCVAAASLSEPGCTSGIKPLATCLALQKKFGVRPSLEPAD